MKRKLTIISLSALSALLAVAVAVMSIVLVLNNKAEVTDPVKEYYNSHCASFAIQNLNAAKGQIVFIGDSITDLYVLDDHYGDIPLATYNRGIGGDTTSGVLGRLKVSAYDILPSKVVLMIGTNDVNMGAEEADILDRYEKIVDGIMKNITDVELYCMSIIPMNTKIEEYSSLSAARSNATIMRLNPELKKIAESHGAVYLDLFSHLTAEDGTLDRRYSDDGLHLNVDGLTVWTNLIKPYLDTTTNDSK